MRLRAALLLLLLSGTQALAKTRPHVVALGKPRVVTWTVSGSDETLTLQVRPLFIDERRKEWTTGEAHDVTDHSFVVLQAQQINDASSSDKAPHFIWQTGAWLLVERNTGHITVLRLAGYDPALSGISWFRDYAAYCALSAQAKSVYAEVLELNQHKPVARKKVAAWPLPPAPPAPVVTPLPMPEAPRIGPMPRVPSVIQRMNTGLPHPLVCSDIEWMRDPIRAVVTPRADLPPVTLDLSTIPMPATGTEPAPEAAPATP